jgi:hypothetical protein
MVLWRKVGLMLPSAALMAVLQIGAARELVYQWLLPPLGKGLGITSLLSLLVQKWVSCSPIFKLSLLNPPSLIHY